MNMGRTAMLVAVVAICGCGDLEMAEVDVEPLTVLELHPHYGEEIAAQDLVVVVVFSETVQFGEAGGDVNQNTFFLEDDDGNLVENTTVENSEPDPQNATALLRLPDPSPLASGETYWVVLKESIRGIDPDGKDTRPLGEDIRSWFVVQ